MTDEAAACLASARCGAESCPGVFPSSLFRDKNRCDIGKSQSKWTASKIANARLTTTDMGTFLRGSAAAAALSSNNPSSSQP
jgi:hypothetical protein